MMDVDISSSQSVFQITIFDEDKTRSSPGLLYTTTHIEHFDNKESMMTRWQEVIRENHLDATLLKQDILIAFAHGQRKR